MTSSIGWWNFWWQVDYRKLKKTNKRNRASETGGSLHTDGSTTYEATRERMQRRRSWSCGPEQPPIDEEELWTRIAGDHKMGRIYGMGVVSSHSYPPLFGDPDFDEDTATGPPDLRKQAETHAQRVAAVEAVCEEKVRTLETMVQSQLQEFSELRKAYSKMYSFLTQKPSSGSSSVTMPPPPPPPLPLDPGVPLTTLFPWPRMTPIMFYLYFREGDDIRYFSSMSNIFRSLSRRLSIRGSSSSSSSNLPSPNPLTENVMT
ncbi:hypothetical protein PIB30_059162, partial [Stylosanthes scabra]|nr:hypothetical protein [Stylosanthes scabra]